MNGISTRTRAAIKAPHTSLLALTMMIAIVGAPGAWAQSSPAPFMTGHRYDAGGREAGVILPKPEASGPVNYAATRTTYDSDGRIWKVEKGELQAWQGDTILPANWTGFTIFQIATYTYDSRGRKIRSSISEPNGTVHQVTQFSYDEYDRPVCTAVRMNPAAYASQLPADACLQGPEGVFGRDRITKNNYDTLGQLTTIQRGVGTPLEQNYATYEFVYSGLGNLDKPVSISDANGNKTTMVYGGSVFNHLTKTTFPSASTPGQVNPNDFETYGYDAGGNRTSMRKRDGQVINYTYDALGRVTLKDLPGGSSADVYYGYDLRGLQLHARFGSASGAGITNSYDGFGRMKTTSNNMSGTPKTLSFEWDANGNRIRITHPDTVFFTYDYDGLNRNTAIRENGTGVIATATFNAQGRRSGDTRGAASTSYSYDPVARIASISDDLSGSSYDLVTEFSYNPASQAITRKRSNDSYAFDAYPQATVSRPYTANGLNQYTAAGQTNFTYDANGNLTGDGTVAYTYDVENRLVTKTGGTTPNATLQYDPLGRLWRIVLPTVTQELTYDANVLVSESSGSVTARYVHGNGVDDPLIWYVGAGLTDRRSLQIDGQKSVVSVALANGVLANVNTYDEYGIPGTTNAGRFQYTGQIYISQIGLYYFKARMYSPTLGRFLQTDPIGYEDQINLYTYAGNDPGNKIDPDGKQVVAVYDPETRILMVMDRDTGRIVVAQNVITGLPGLRPDQTNGPLPKGEYAILEYNGPHAGGEDTWFRLEALDGSFGDDSRGNRSNFRLHNGTVSLGCITMCEATQGRNVIGLIEGTSTGTATVKGAWGSPSTWGGQKVKDYGRMYVGIGRVSIDKDRNLILTIPGRNGQPDVQRTLCRVQKNGDCTSAR